MNPRRFLPALAACLLITATSAPCMPGWLKEVTEEASSLEASEDATAIVLRRVADVEISSSGRAKTKTQTAYKILTRDGLRFGTLSQAVYPFLKVKNLKGWVIDSEGKARELEDEQVVTIGLQGSAGYYDDSHVMVGSLSHVEPGDIVAFEMEIEEKGWTSFHQSFVFQVQQPVRFARFSMTVPGGWQVIHGGWRIGDISYEQQGNRYTWTATDLEHQPDEPLAPSWHYLSRRISVTCSDPDEPGASHFADWPAVARWCAEVYAEPSLTTEEVASDCRILTDGLLTFEAKVKAIAEFCQSEIRYVAVEIGKNRWLPRAAPTTLFNRYGDCKDKAVLMRSMLKAVEINSAPVLCNPSYPVDQRVPTPFQFNHVIVAIPVEDHHISPAFANAIVGGWLFFDPTDQSTRIGQIPWILQGDRVLVAAETDSVLLRLPYPDPEDFRRTAAAEAGLNEDGSFLARVRIVDFGGATAYSRYIHRVTSEKEQIDDWIAVFSQAVPSIEITDYETGEAGDSVWATFSMKGGHYVQDAGGLSLLHPDFFYAPSPPVLTSKERLFPVWFGPPKELISEVSWILPQGWTADVEAGTMEYECAGASVASSMASDTNALSVTTTYRQMGHLIWPEDYESARMFDRNFSQVKGRVVMIHKR